MKSKVKRKKKAVKKTTKPIQAPQNESISQEDIMRIYIDFCFEVVSIGLDHIVRGQATDSPVQQIELAVDELQARFEFEKAEAMKRV